MASEITAQKTDDNAAPTKPNSGFLQDVEQETKPLQMFLTKFNNDWTMNLAAALAYNLLVAIFPILIALLAILGFILRDPQTQQKLVQQIISVLPQLPQTAGGQAAANDAIRTIFNQLARISGILGIIALLTTIFGGSRLFILIEACFSIIYRVRPRPLLRQNLMAIGMLFLFILSVPILITTSSWPAFVFSLLQNTPLNTIPGISFFLSLGGILGSLFVGWFLFQMVYLIVPNQRISFRHSWLGAVLAAVALQLYLSIFSWYASRFLGGYVGQVGFAIIIITFFYYFALILLLGAQINAFFSEHIRPLPNDIVTFTTTMAGKLNQDIPELEAEKHIDSSPTEQANKAYIVGLRKQEKANQQKNKRLGRQIAARNSATNKEQSSRDTTTKQQAPGKLSTLFSVLAGTSLAFLIELLRARRQR